MADAPADSTAASAADGHLSAADHLQMAHAHAAAAAAHAHSAGEHIAAGAPETTETSDTAEPPVADGDTPADGRSAYADGRNFPGSAQSRAGFRANTGAARSYRSMGGH
jgi:hypothetical protein